MIRIGIMGDIGSGKSYVASNFGYPVFNADQEVSGLYKNNRKIFRSLNKLIPKYIVSFPIKNGIPQLGTWQGVYLCEHRNCASKRRIVITLIGNCLLSVQDL